MSSAGSLEGYLYERENAEPLDDWVGNREKMYAGLPDNIKREIRDEFTRILTRTSTYGEKVLQDKMKTRLNNLLLKL